MTSFAPDAPTFKVAKEPMTPPARASFKRPTAHGGKAPPTLLYGDTELTSMQKPLRQKCSKAVRSWGVPRIRSKPGSSMKLLAARGDGVGLDIEHVLASIATLPLALHGTYGKMK